MAKKSRPQYFWNLFFILIEWTCVFAAIAVARDANFIVKFLAIVLIGTRQHALGVLMHEASHFGLLPNRQWNDLVANFFLAWPGLFTVQGYRYSHLAHHRYNLTDNDPVYIRKMALPEYRFPQSRKQLALNLAKKFLGLGFFEGLKRTTVLRTQKKNTARSEKIQLLIFVVIAFLLIVASGELKNFLVFWLLPAATILPGVSYIRTVSEHLGLPVGCNVRSISAAPWEKFLFFPYNIGLHGEHHVDPSVSWANLSDVVLPKHSVSKVVGVRGLYQQLVNESFSST